MPHGAPRDYGPENAGRLHAAPKMSQPHGLAGHPSGKSTSVRTVLTGVDDGSDMQPKQRAPPKGERHQYEHPSYSISRSSNGAAAKEILYGGGDVAPGPAAPTQQSQQQQSQQQQSQQQQSQPPLPPGAEDHPALPLYNFLAEQVPQLPRDEQGCTQESAMRAALQAVGIEMSLDGFAELLARCDVSPTGFPPFGDFLLCLSRPARPPPSNPTSGAGAVDAPPPPAQAEPSSAADAAAPTSAAQPSVGWADSAVAPPPPSVAPRGSAPARPQYQQPGQYRSQSEMAEVTRAMQDAKAAAMMPMPPPRAPVQPIVPSSEGQRTWGQMQLEQKVKQQQQQTRFNVPNTPLANANPNGSTSRLGVPLPKPGGSFPLGIKSDVPTLGTNVAALYGKSRHASSQKFTNSFNPDHFLF